MKTLKIYPIPLKEERPDLEIVSEYMDVHCEWHHLDNQPWADEFAYKPEVQFKIAYTPEEIFIKYYVTEQSVKAEKSADNEMVCEDSCVEFFVSPGEDGIYYNFEFNPIGTCLLGHGLSREDSRTANPEWLDKVRRLGSFGSQPFSEIDEERSWELIVAVPKKVFFRHEIAELKGRTFKANFYKCGDRLKEPHYISWNDVKTEHPDYHRPEYFGEITFC